MAKLVIPEGLANLHVREEVLRDKAISLIVADPRLILHLNIIEHAMDLAYILRQFPTDDEDFKVLQLMGMRLFNAFGASVNLALSGYGQNSALVMRDILETVFLLDLFKSDRPALERWRFADKKAYEKEFSPVRVREALDKRDGFSERKRAAIYKLFSELAGHPTMKSMYMMRPDKDGDAHIGPFIERPMLEAIITEMGKLAIQAGELLDAFFPSDWSDGAATRVAFAKQKKLWTSEFFSHAKRK